MNSPLQIKFFNKYLYLCTQAQRDFFGSHTYQRTDKEGWFHTVSMPGCMSEVARQKYIAVF